MRHLQKDKLHPHFLLCSLLPFFSLLLFLPSHSPLGGCQILSPDLPCFQKPISLVTSQYPIVGAGHSRPTGYFPVFSSFAEVENSFFGDNADVLVAPSPYSCHWTQWSSLRALCPRTQQSLPRLAHLIILNDSETLKSTNQCAAPTNCLDGRALRIVGGEPGS